MNVIALLVTSFLTSAAFASFTEIQCIERGSENQRLHITFNQETVKVEGISQFDVTAGQTPVSTFKKSIAQHVYYAYFISVVLEDETQILIPGTVLDGKTKGIVHTGTGREFNCN
jgi:hypothetical protein